MVIQRIQTLLLLLAAIMTGLFALLPFISVDGNLAPEILNRPIGYPVLFVLSLASTAVLLIDIFLFKNLTQQLNIAKICVLLIIGMGVLAFIAVYSGNAPQGVSLCWYSIVFLAVALASTLYAVNRINRDRRTLRSLNSFR